MITRAILYYLACGDVEATLYDVNDDSIVVVDCDPKGAALIEFIVGQAVQTTVWDSEQPNVVSVSLLTF